MTKGRAIVVFSAAAAIAAYVWWPGGSDTTPRPFHRLYFDANGALKPSSRAAYDAAVADAGNAADIVVMSHGWWNDESSADCTYAAMAEGFRGARPASVAADRRVVLIAVYWPSAVFPLGEKACGVPAAPVEESTRPAYRPADFSRWVDAAFPDAAGVQSFAAERSRLQELLDRAATPESVTKDEGTEILRILSAWEQRTTRESTAPESPGERNIRRPVDELATAFVPERRGSMEEESGGPRAWLNGANVFTFWAMKSRAGVVGTHGVFDLLRALQPARDKGARLHLAAHSFGGKLLSAALVGTGGTPNRADSFLILQGALSHFAFSTADQLAALRVDTSQPGLYRQIVADRLVGSTFAVTYSSHDLPNRIAYPLGVRLSRDDFEARPSRWGSLGADGFQGPQATPLAIGQLSGSSPGLWNIDASDVISGHTEFQKPEVYRLMWTVIESR